MNAGNCGGLRAEERRFVTTWRRMDARQRLAYGVAMRASPVIFAFLALLACSNGPTIDPEDAGRDSSTERPDTGAPGEDAGTIIEEEPVPLGSRWIPTDGPIGGGELIGGRADWALARIGDRFAVTHDRGLTWSPSALALDSVERVVGAVGDGATIQLATDRALRVSTDGGATFATIATTPAVSEIFSMHEVAGTLYVVARPAAPAGALPAAFRSTDGGATLTVVRDDVGFFFVTADVMLANSASGTLVQVRSVDGGASWEDVDGLVGLSPRNGAVVDAGGALYLLRSQTQLSLSSDRGVTWTAITLPAEARIVDLVLHGAAVLAIDASGGVHELSGDALVARSDLALRSWRSPGRREVLALGGDVLLASPGDVLRYDGAAPDEGWQRAPLVGTTPVHMACVGRSLFAAHGSVVSGWSESAAWAAPLDPAVDAPAALLGPISAARGKLYLGRQASVLVSIDGGLHFETASSDALAASGGEDEGVSITAFAHRGDALFAGMLGTNTGHADSHGETGVYFLVGGGVLESTDDGSTWSQLATGMLERTSSLSTRPASIDDLTATHGGYLLAAVLHGSELPHRTPALMRFDPAARTWEELASAPRLPETEPEALRGTLPSLHLRTGSERVFAYASRFLFASDDDGASWVPIARPPGLEDPAAGDATRTLDPNRWPPITVVLARGELLVAATGGHIAVSSDGGATFSLVDDGLEGVRVTGLAACGGVGLFAGVADRGVYRLVDAP